jgi:hypothetical protein
VVGDIHITIRVTITRIMIIILHTDTDGIDGTGHITTDPTTTTTGVGVDTATVTTTVIGTVIGTVIMTATGDTADIIMDIIPIIPDTIIPTPTEIDTERITGQETVVLEMMLTEIIQGLDLTITKSITEGTTQSEDLIQM